ncbi:MAG: class I SAM-dependent methyltransferase [Acidimicrobiales bacterium]
MEGYDASTYGDRFAEVYDDWYSDLTDATACVDVVAGLADGGPVLELGVGTGRLAIPLAARGLVVVGLDASPAMLERMAAKPGGAEVEALVGDMAAPPLGDRRFAVVFVAYNTLFNLIDPADQARCLADAAARLRPGGSILVEAFVPEPERIVEAVTPRTITADRVVLSISRTDPETQEALGQYVDITEAGIRLRPWHIRWSTPDQLDAMAAEAGLTLADRWADWRRSPFHADAPAHVSHYRPA